jgi:hypothetical protein
MKARASGRLLASLWRQTRSRWRRSRSVSCGCREEPEALVGRPFLPSALSGLALGLRGLHIVR